jgi:hypothetical protein
MLFVSFAGEPQSQLCSTPNRPEFGDNVMHRKILEQFSCALMGEVCPQQSTHSTLIERGLGTEPIRLR